MSTIKKSRKARLARRAANLKKDAEATRDYFTKPEVDVVRSRALKQADKHEVERVGDKRGRKVRVKLSDLNIDHSYQYEPERERGRVNQLMNWLLERGGFDPLEAGPIHVNMRADGSLWIVDGGGRAWMANKAGDTMIDAIVFEGLSWDEEQQLFLDKNNKKRTIRRPHMFIVEAAKGEQPHKGIIEFLDESAYGMERTVGDGGCSLFAASALLFVWYLDGTGNILRLALLDLRNTVGDETGVDGRLLIAVGWMRALGAGSDTKHLRYIIQHEPRDGNGEVLVPVKTTLARARHESGRFITTRAPQSRDTNPYLLDVLLGRFNFNRHKTEARRINPRNIADFKARFDEQKLVERFGEQQLYRDVWNWNGV